MHLSKTFIFLMTILLIGTGLRLVGVGHPFSGHHSWRQADTAAIARNFSEERLNILYPRIDWRGATTGEVECEFPIYQFLVAMLYQVFGLHEIIGRLISVLFSIISILGVYFLAKSFGGMIAGLWSSFFFAILPMPSFFGRAFMPESFLAAACIYSVILFLKWTESHSFWFLFLSALFMTIACLIKPQTLYLALPLGYLAFLKLHFRAFINPALSFFVVVILLAMAAWYFHAHQLQEVTGLSFGIWEYGSDKWGNWDLLGSWKFWETLFVRRIPRYVFSYFGLLLAMFGFFRPLNSKREFAMKLWFLALFLYIIVVAKGVLIHDYYLLPAAIPAAYFMGKASAWGLDFQNGASKYIRIGVAVCILGALGVSLATHFKWLNDEKTSNNPNFQAAQAAAQALPRDSLVLTFNDGNPMMLYYAHLKSWRIFPHDLSRQLIEDRTRDGAKYIIAVKDDFKKDNASSQLEWLLSEYATILSCDRYFILSTKR
jgi:hypothetical protein